MLRDECGRRIYYPDGSEALRVFSRVRGRVRSQIRKELSLENQQLFDEWSEEVSAKQDEIERLQETNQSLESENGRLRQELEERETKCNALMYHLRSTVEGRAEGYGPPVVGGDEDVLSN